MTQEGKQKPALRNDDGFERRLSAAKAKQDKRLAPTHSADGAAMGIGMRLSLELVVATGIGALIGYGLDRLLGSSPWMLMLFVLVGAGAGLKNMLRAMDEIDAAQKAAARERDAGAHTDRKAEKSQAGQSPDT